MWFSLELSTNIIFNVITNHNSDYDLQFITFHTIWILLIQKLE